MGSNVCILNPTLSWDDGAGHTSRFSVVLGDGPFNKCRWTQQLNCWKKEWSQATSNAGQLKEGKCE